MIGLNFLMKSPSFGGDSLGDARAEGLLSLGKGGKVDFVGVIEGM